MAGSSLVCGYSKNFKITNYSFSKENYIITNYSIHTNNIKLIQLTKQEKRHERDNFEAKFKIILELGTF